MWVEPANELLCFALVVDEVTIEFKESSEDTNDNSSGEDAWPNPVTEEVEEEEDVEFPLRTMGVPPLEENDEPYPDPWMGVMDMNAIYTNTMVPGVDDDNIPLPVGVGVGQRFMTKDALQMYFKDYCISRHVKFKRQVVRGRSSMCIISDRHSGIIRAVADVFPRPHRHRFCIQHIMANLKKRYSVKDLDKMVWRCASAETVDHYNHAIQNLEETRAELTEGMSHDQWALAYDGNMSFGKLTTNSSESVNSLLKRARSLPVQALASAIFYRMNAWFVHKR
ncbi:hypothetical protein H6P81_012279 [Aristolochia fimbriata]|uniref:MULE transposase domain-containing protein n=1 Tax=Aristolochia fimbriata TaxID=158543 RepID=A0AAV7ECN4_ARIFI|nr:hypothetical protein H6P81_012279 [Aristolochia fimbriata]